MNSQRGRHRLRIDSDVYAQYKSLNLENVSLSALLSELLASWVCTEQIKQEFKRLDK